MNTPTMTLPQIPGKLCQDCKEVPRKGASRWVGSGSTDRGNVPDFNLELLKTTSAGRHRTAHSGTELERDDPTVLDALASSLGLMAG